MATLVLLLLGPAAEVEGAVGAKSLSNGWVLSRRRSGKGADYGSVVLLDDALAVLLDGLDAVPDGVGLSLAGLGLLLEATALMLSDLVSLFDGFALTLDDPASVLGGFPFNGVLT